MQKGGDRGHWSEKGLKLKESGVWEDWKSLNVKMRRQRAEGEEIATYILEEDLVISRTHCSEVRRMERWYNGWNYGSKKLKLKWFWENNIQDEFIDFLLHASKS